MFLFFFTWSHMSVALRVFISIASFSSAPCGSASCSCCSGCEGQEMRGYLCVLLLLGAIDGNMTLVEVAPLWNSACDKRGEEVPPKP